PGGKLGAGGTREEIASGLYSAAAEARLPGVLRGEVAGGGHAGVEDAGDGDGALVVAAQVGPGATPEEFGLAQQSFEERGAGVQDRGVAQPEVLGGRVGSRAGAELGDADGGEQPAQRARALLREE